MAPPSSSSSGSESESSTSSSDEEQEEHQQQQQKKEAAQAKASPPPVKKKPVVPKQQHKTKPQKETASPPPVKKKPVVPNQQVKTKPQKETASPPPARKKPVLKNNKKPPPPVPRSAAVPADDDSSRDEDPSDSPPKTKPSPSPSRLRSPKPSSSTEPISSSKPEELTPAAASQQLRSGKERKRQRQGAEDEQGGDAAAASGPSSKKLFQRVWMEEDEIALLEGMLDFHDKHGGTRPVPDIDAFSEFISAALQGDFSKTQLYYKIRRLRNKYERNLRRGQKGADPSFAKPHEQAAFELSKKIWPTGEGDTHNYRDDDTGIKIKTKDGGRKMGRQGAGPLYPRLTEAISLLEKEDGNSFLAQSASRALGSLKPTKAKALEDRWNNHFIAGAKYLMERARLKKELLQSLVKIVDTE